MINFEQHFNNPKNFDKVNKKVSVRKEKIILNDFEKAIITHSFSSGLKNYHRIYEKSISHLFNSLSDAYRYLVENEVEDGLHKVFGVNQRKFTFIDLFAGIGGFRLALQNLGGECVFSSEWNSSARKTYFNNYGEIPFGDITESKNRDLIPRKFDILCAGFPCQPFSLAGVSARTSLGHKHGFEDESQGNLFFEILKIVDIHRPKVLFLENVKNLKSHDNGKTFVLIREMIEARGYSFLNEVMSSSSLVPQNRQRTYIVCFRNPKTKFKFPELKGLPKPLKSILESNVPDKYTISDKLWEGHQNRTIRNIDRGTGFTAFLADLNKPSKTLVARYGKDGKECLIPQDGLNPRKLTPRECARLQGYPENFLLPSSDAAAYRQFGNSVSVPLIQLIGHEIIKSLKIKT